MAQIPLCFFVELSNNICDLPFFLLPKTKQDKYIDELRKILQSLKTKLYKTQNKVYKLANTLENSLTDNELDEVLLSDSLKKLTSVFNDRDSEYIMQLMKKLIDNCEKIHKRAVIFSAIKEKNAKLKKDKTGDEVLALDKKTIFNEGMIYCLEFYLAIYKAMLDVNEEKRNYYLTEDSIEIGTGQSTGLTKDLNNDEVLLKFILLLLNDSWRERLMKSYYNLKINVIKFQGNDVENDMNYGMVDKTMENMRMFLLDLLNICQEAGFTNIRSVFYKPYGIDPKIEEVKLAILK